jgi:hypothetical protein
MPAPDGGQRNTKKVGGGLKVEQRWTLLIL